MQQGQAGQQGQQIDVLLQRAQQAQNSAHYAEAASLYASATRLSPATPELWSNRGVMEFLSGQTAKSITSLQHANGLDPNLLPPVLFLGKAYLKSDKPASALPYLNRAHALQPNDVEVLLSLGKANAEMDQARVAAGFYAKAAQLAPSNADAWFGLGMSTLKTISADGSEIAVKQPQSVWARALFADELFEQGRPLEARDTYKAALGKATPAQGATVIQNLRWMQSRPDLFALPANSEEALEKLIRALQAHQHTLDSPSCDKPEMELSSSVRLADAVAPSLHEAGCAYLGGDYERSAAQAQAVLQRSPHDAEALYWSVKANERIAVAALAKFEELSPETAAKHVLVGNLYRFQRNPDAALIEYKKALAVDAQNPAAMMGAVLTCISTSRLQEAAAIDRSALASRPLDPELNLLMAEILDAGSDHTQERTYLAKALDGPADLQPRAHSLLGRLDAADGKTAEAIEQFQLALPSDKDGSLHYQLARLYRKTGNMAEADKLMAQAKALIDKRETNAAVVVREATAASQ